MKRLMIQLATVLIVLGICLSPAWAGDVKSVGNGGKLNWSSSATWLGGVLPTAADNVIIANGDTVYIDVNQIQIAGLQIGESASARAYFRTDSAVTLTVNGDILVNANCEFDVNNNTKGGNLIHTIILKGNLTNNGTLDLRSGTSNSTLTNVSLIFAGAGDNIVSVGTYVKSPDNNEFGRVIINKEGTGRVILQSHLVCAGGSSSVTDGANPTVELVRGFVESQGGALIATWGTDSAMVGFSDSSYVIGAVGRGMSNSGGTSRTFPLGDADGYRPVKVYSNSAGGATGHCVIVGIETGNANTGSSTFAGGIDKVSAIRYYKLEYRQGFVGALGNPSMEFKRALLPYRDDDGVAAGNQNLRVAISADDRATWTGVGPTVTPHTTALDPLPQQIPSDSLTVVVEDSTKRVFALARATGTTENELQKPSSSVEQLSALPGKFSLDQNYPNPFNPSTSIRFSIERAGFTTVRVMDVLGRVVATLVNDELPAGSFVVTWDADGFASGTYVCALQSGGSHQLRKMVLVK